MSRFQPGALVRPTKPGAISVFARSIPFGAVVEVASLESGYPDRHGQMYRIKATADIPAYLLPEHALKPAKQAERKRAEYANRRG